MAMVVVDRAVCDLCECHGTCDGSIRVGRGPCIMALGGFAKLAVVWAAPSFVDVWDGSLDCPF